MRMPMAQQSQQCLRQNAADVLAPSCRTGDLSSTARLISDMLSEALRMPYSVDSKSLHDCKIVPLDSEPCSLILQIVTIFPE